jgi:hypothetical protein
MRPCPLVQGRPLRIEDPKAIAAWMRRVVELQEDKGHYDYEANKYIVEHRGGEKSLFDATEATEVFKLPKPLSRRAFEVIGIPFERPGFYVVDARDMRYPWAPRGLARAARSALGSPTGSRTRPLPTAVSSHSRSSW